MAEGLTYEICQAILNDTDGDVAVLRLYVDESGHEDDSPVVVVAGYITRPTEWRRFEREWRRHILQARPKISAYHAADAQNLSDEFKGWTHDGVVDLAKKLLPIIPKYAHGVAIGVVLKDVNEALEQRPELKPYCTDIYAMCFQWVLHTFADLLSKSDRPIAVVHEQNSFRGRADIAFEYVKKRTSDGRKFTSITWGDKITFPPLQAADILAYEFFRRLRNPTGPERKALTALCPPGRVPALKCFDKRNVASFIQMLEDHKKSHEEGRLVNAPRFKF